MDRNFLQILKKHRRKYSLMEPQDVGKLIYQSEFGPEHMVCDKGQAESSLIGEWNVLPKDSGGVLPEEGSLSGRSAVLCAGFHCPYAKLPMRPNCWRIYLRLLQGNTGEP